MINQHFGTWGLQLYLSTVQWNVSVQQHTVEQPDEDRYDITYWHHSDIYHLFTINGYGGSATYIIHAMWVAGIICTVKK